MADQQYCLRWNNHQSTLISVFDSLQERGCMVDCTLAAEGQSLQAHKVVLSACSPYLEDLLSKHYDKHPILLLKDVKFEELKAMMDYMYRGEVNVAQDKLNTFIRAAESLQIKGLSDGGSEPPDTGGTSMKRTSKGAPVSVRSNQQLTVRKTNSNDNGSRDGSVSPSLRKRRRRRGSEGSDQDSSSNVPDGRQSSAAAPVSGPSVNNEDMLPTVPTSGSADTNILFSSIMENNPETETATDSGIDNLNNDEALNENVIRNKDNVLVQPKTEYLDDDAQDLPLDEDDGMFRAGPSHARGSGSYVGDADDVYMNQDSGANAQDVKVLAELPISANGKKETKDEKKEDGADNGLVISSVGFVKEELHSVTIKGEPKDEDDVLMDNGLPLPRPEENDDQIHDDVFTNPAYTSNDEGEEQVRRSKRQYFCKQCPATFNRPNHLKRHEVVHGARKPFACPHCTASFPSDTRLSAHIVVHTGEAGFRCEKCGDSFSTQALLNEHMTTHTWRCPYCTSVFGTLHGLKIHARTHNKNINQFMCSECPESFTAKDELKAHKKAAHPTAPPPPPPQEDEAVYECEYCDEKFTTTLELLMHAKEHADKEHRCEKCPAGFDTRKELVTHVHRHHPRMIKCTKCDLTFPSLPEMKLHLATHDIDDEHLRCEFCPKVFSTNYHLLNHMSSHNERFECSECDSKFNTRAMLEIHAKSHTEGAFRCEDCGKRFQFKPQLIAHIRLHDDQKPFPCEDCPIRFKTEAQLAKHARSHKLVGINCSDCGAPFMNTYQLQEHMLHHHAKKTKLHWCEDCAETFPTKALLDQHIRTHPDKDLFQCEHCPLKFATEYGLQQHMRTHSDKRPFLCGYCEASFTLKEHMIRHMKAHKKK